MGWTFHYNTSRAQLIEHILAPISEPSYSVTTLRHCCIGNNLWAVREKIDARSTDRYILLCLLRPDKKNDGWGYKDMDDTMGPYYYNCPLSYLDLLTEPENDWSREWREKVRAYHAEQATIRKLQAGASVLIYGKPYTVAMPLTKGRGFWVRRDDNQQLYTARVSQITLPKGA